MWHITIQGQLNITPNPLKKRANQAQSAKILFVSLKRVFWALNKTLTSFIALSMRFIKYCLYPWQRGKKPNLKGVSRVWHYNASDSESLVLEIREVWSTPSLPLFPGPLKPGMVVPVRAISMAQKDLFKNYLYSIGLCAKKLNNTKNIYMNIQWMWFLNI